MSRAKQSQEERVSMLRRRFRNYAEPEERVIADAIERVRAALSPLSTWHRRRVFVAVAALFGDMPLVHAIMGTRRVEAFDTRTRTNDLAPPLGVSL